MSNKIVPTIYRAIIDDVVAAMKTEFDEYGVSEDVLADLQHKWETKVIASHVADFESPSVAQQQPVPPRNYPPPQPMIPHYQHPYTALPGPGQATVKTEPMDSRYILNAYALPPLPGPQIPGRPPTTQPPVLTYPPQPPLPGPKIPQVDGPSSSGSDSPSPPTFAPRSQHPSLPQPPQPTSAPADNEAINSDLDDSDSEEEEDAQEDGPGDGDIVFCTYDKVARVKNKWKCILKDGMIHVNGKDYLFAKCTGEFEW
ncbi:transcription factor IIA, alpha/beta subunit [Thelephora ganbajun]|uniref:Transcription factor IIA, alpha/beta subunit n=1 Tax=Thelephora ganbajun TaxID=370292 RepID=A0ACB6ZWN9_THEGA|nr:transcription factor IIA, alpha/beta subunit [Thelephora ganbajun]